MKFHQVQKMMTKKQNPVRSNRFQFQWGKLVIFVTLNLLVFLTQNTCTCTGSQTTYYSSGIAHYNCDTTCSPKCVSYPTAWPYINALSTTIAISTCTPCQTGCNVCTTPWVCSQCDTGYGLAGGTWCLVCQSLLGISDCATCDSVKCLSCDSGKVRDLSVAAPHSCVTCTIPNCQTCADGPTCAVCNSAYALDLVSTPHTCILCSTIPSCLTCTDGIICTSCGSGKVLDYSLANNGCVTCSTISNCVTCTNGPVCTGCASGFALDGSAHCVSCSSISNCASCSNGPVCNGCNSGFVKDLSQTNHQCVSCTLPFCQTCADGPVCSQCSAGYALNTNGGTNTCVACSSIPNCSTCQNGPICLTCLSPYIRDLSVSNFACVACTVQNCQTCTDGPVCSVCNAGFFKDLSTSILTKICVSCAIPNCQTCNDGPICGSCVSGYAFDLSVTPNECVSCSTISNCQSCSNGPICTACLPDTYFDLSTAKKSCVPCTISNCVQCADGPICVKCMTNYILDTANGNKNCLACLIQQYSSTALNQCLPCPSGCLSCSENPSNPTVVICTQCLKGYYLQNDQCFLCSSSMVQCKQCSNGSVCDLCTEPFSVGQTGICDTCIKGYFYVDTLCTINPGCKYSLPGTKKCLSCFTNYNYIYIPASSSCGCDKGYKQTKTLTNLVCMPQCGDGIFISPDQECDDMNLRNKDGCDQFCKRQSNFDCGFETPSQCTLTFNFIKIQHNYALKIQGKNRCKFSFSIFPYHQSLAYFDWQKHLSVNISRSWIAPGSLQYKYDSSTREILLQFDYLHSIQQEILQAKLSFAQNPVSSSNLNLLNSKLPFQEKAQSSSSSFIKINSIPNQLTVDLIVHGLGEPLIFNDEGYLAMYQSTSYISLVVAVVALLQFLIGSYVHKMIGLETIQVIQLFFFMRMMLYGQQNSLLNAINVLKYVAYSGYSNPKVLTDLSQSQIQNIALTSIEQEFFTVGLQRYFIFDVNFPLMIPCLIFIIFLINMIRKYWKRNVYLQTLDQSDKDEYTQLNRSYQWIYNHGVFPFTMIFFMIAVFCIIIELTSRGENEQKQNKNASMVQTINHGSIMIMSMIKLSIMCFEIFLSYSDYMKSQLSSSQKPPSSTIQKLEYDQNNPDRANFKPGYVLFYLTFYFIIVFCLIFNVLLHKQRDLIGFCMIGCSLVGLVAVWVWNPYSMSTNFHNKAIRLNSFSNFFCMVVFQLFNKVTMDKWANMALVYVLIAILATVQIVGFIRIYIEIKFRKELLHTADLVIFDYQPAQPKRLKQKEKEIFPTEVLQQLSQPQKITSNPYTHQVSHSVELLVPDRISFGQTTIEAIKQRLRLEVKSPIFCSNSWNFTPLQFFQDEKKFKNYPKIPGKRI